MKLSEAIRLGSMLKPQCFGSYFGVGLAKESSCAMGAAMDAINAKSIPYIEDWQWITYTTAKCPHSWASKHCPSIVHSIITHLNDSHRWTREAIADWVQTIEPNDIPTVESQETRTVPVDEMVPV